VRPKNLKRLCVVCHTNPAEVPDRYAGVGRRIKTVCRACHYTRLQEDVTQILRSRVK
jgi:hypothetical protein